MCVRLVLLLFFPIIIWSQSLETVIQKGHRAAVHCIALSHNGKFLVSGSKDKSAILWDLSTQKQIRTFNGHGGAVNSVVFSPDDKYMATASGDMTAKLWNLSTGEVVYTLEKQRDYLTAVAFHPSRKIMAIGGYPFEVLIIDYEQKTVLERIPCAPDKGSGDGISLSFSTDGQYLLMGEDNRTVRLLDTKDFKDMYTMKNKEGYCGGCGTHAALSPSNKWIAKMAHNDTIKIYDISTKTLIAKLGGYVDKAGGVGFSSDEHSLFSVADDTVRIYDLKSGTEIKRWSLKRYNLGDVNSMVVCESKGALILAADKNKIVSIDIRTGEVVNTFAGINNFVDKGGVDYDPESYWESYIARYLY
ncbi:MAG TPA: WD40 repeat domain-containing protein, partial [Cytophagales bacterium]|nr:WD40 repeat domain-containing protein [Cytophagales bacterium]